MARMMFTEKCNMCNNVNRFYAEDLHGYVTRCQYCDSIMRLCSLCKNANDNANKYCDFHNDINGGVCFRDDRPVKLWYKKTSISDKISFTVPKNWLYKAVCDKYETIKNFIENYSYLNDGYTLYSKAKEDDILMD